MRFSILVTAYSASMRRQSTLTGMRFVVFPYVGAWTFWDWTSSASNCFSSNVLILRVYRKPCTFAPRSLPRFPSGSRLNWVCIVGRMLVSSCDTDGNYSSAPTVLLQKWVQRFQQEGFDARRRLVKLCLHQ